MKINFMLVFANIKFKQMIFYVSSRTRLVRDNQSDFSRANGHFLVLVH